MDVMIPDHNRILKSMFASTFAIMLLASVAMLLGTLVDGILIGNFMTTDDMAAYGLIHPVTILLLAVTGIFSSGSQILCTKYMSLGEPEKANRVFSLTFVLLLLVSAVLTAVFLVFSTQTVVLLGASGDLLPLGKDYLIGLAIGFPGVLLATVLAPFAQLEGNQKIAVISVAAMVGVNVCGDLANVLLLDGGIFGMGIATSAGSYCAFLVLFFHFLLNKKGYRLTFRSLCWRYTGRIILPGLPTAGSRLFATFRTLFLNYVLLAISTNAAVAAYSARMNVGTFFASAGSASGMATLSLTGIFYGEEDRTMLRKMFRIVLFYSILISTAIMVFLLLFSDPVIALYMSADAETMQLSARALRFCAVSLPFYAINNVLANYLQAIRRLVFTNILLFCQNLGFCLLSVWITCPFMGTDAVWFCYVTCEIATTFLYFLIAALYNMKLPSGSKNLMMLRADYGISSDDLLEGTFHTAKEAEALSMRMEVFCLSRCLDEDKANKVALVFEEMTANILQHGFADGKRHDIDYRLFRKNGDFILRLRDDCPSFNPVAKLEDMDKQHDTEHMGIRITSSIAKDVSYIKIMNMNNLIITI